MNSLKSVLCIAFASISISAFILIYLFVLNPHTIINLKKIAFVQSTFTDAAYNNAFYIFYSKYETTQYEKKITDDINKLTGVIPDKSSPHSTNGDILRLIDRLRPSLSNIDVTTIRDEDIDNGNIFSYNGTNIYHLLILSHQEYVTQKEYDNLKKFVNNGGIVIFIDSNILYAEIIYSKSKNTVTLVRGHGWEFDGKFAQRSTNERWLSETREWVGSNYWIESYKKHICFLNNPFNYSHYEEQYVSNPKDRIIIDYHATECGVSSNARIATYELDYNRGKIIVMGIYGNKLIDNDRFITFLNKLISKQLHSIPTQ